jgi:peptidylprolyl isomerase
MKSVLSAFALTAMLCASFGLAGEAAAQANRRLPPAPPAPPPPPPPGPNDWRTPDPENLLVIETSKGRIVVELAPFAAPAHVERIKSLARARFYDGLEFFRVVDGFMAQTGDPKNDGTGQSEGPDLKAEFTWRRAPGDDFVSAGTVISSETGFMGSLPAWTQLSMMAPLTADGKVNAWAAFCPGVLGAARGNDPDSANSQFFLMRDHNPSLEKTYTGYGRVLTGLNVVRAIKTGEPVEPPRDTMTTVRIAADLPEADRPKIRVVDPKSAWFKARMNEIFVDRGLVFTPCSVDMPVESR